MKKKRNKKYVPKSVQGIVIQAHMNFFQIDAFMRPMEDFLEQIEKDDVYADASGNPLMDLPNERVLDMARKGKEPRRAVDNIAAVLETYFQLTAYCFSDNDLERVTEEIKSFNRKILRPLKLNTPIQRASLSEAKQLCKNFRSALKQAPAEKVERVSREIRKVIEASHNRKDKTVSDKELRAWLFKELESAA